jgi:hypothetical protein
VDGSAVHASSASGSVIGLDDLVANYRRVGSASGADAHRPQVELTTLRVAEPLTAYSKSAKKSPSRDGLRFIQLL